MLVGKEAFSSLKGSVGSSVQLGLPKFRFSMSNQSFVEWLVRSTVGRWRCEAHPFSVKDNAR